MTEQNNVNELHRDLCLDAIAQIVRDVDGMKEVWCQVDQGLAEFPPLAINTWPAALVTWERDQDYTRVAGLERREMIVGVQILSGPASSFVGQHSRRAMQLSDRLIEDMGNHIMLGGLCTSILYLPGEGVRQFPYDVMFMGVDMEFLVVEERSRDFYP